MTTHPHWLHRAWRMYYDGFRSMTVGRTLWLVVGIKLVIIFAILKIFFFPDILSSEYDDDAQRAQAVRSSLIAR